MALKQRCYDAMNDDFNTPILIAQLFEAVRIINSVNDGNESLTEDAINELKLIIAIFVVQVLGLKDDVMDGAGEITEGLMQLIIKMRAGARTKKISLLPTLCAMNWEN